jgi:hypothetical protein
MPFPDYQAWLDTVIHPRERIATRNSPWCFEHPDWHRHYRGKYELALALQPESILEIGVRYGYSAHAFLAAVPEAFYLGIDSNDPAHNAMGEPTLPWAESMLRRNISECRVEFDIVNTRLQDFRPALRSFKADLVHIDADHSYAGALDDITKGWGVCRRAMLIDDYKACASVRDAVDAFTAKTGATMFVSPSGLGEALLLKDTP